MSIRPLGINHVAFEVRDLEQTLAWYSRWFDYELRGRSDHMAFIDLGDQFIALSEGGPEAPDRTRHVGLVVDGKEQLREALREAGEDVPDSGGLRLRDPSGNVLEIVDYGDVQFTKSPAALSALGRPGLPKSEQARAEMRDKGLLEN